MKFFMFNINDPYPAYESFGEPNLGIGYIKSYLMKYSEIENLDVRILKYNVFDTIKREMPDVIGISSVTQDYNNAIEYAYKIKNSGIKSIILLGGMHISNLPESFSPAFDIGVVGEGEVIVNELLPIINKYGLNKSELTKIKGLVFYDDKGNLVQTERHGLLQNLDELPLPYRRDMHLKTFVHMLTARGCPFTCTFCSSTSFWGRVVRFNSPDYVVKEMLELINYHEAEHISIWDDLFALNTKRIAAIIDLMKQEKKHFNSVSFGVTARASVVNKELCELMKKMNVIRVAVGIESGSEKILKELKGGSASVEGNKKAIDMLKQYGFNVTGGFILGSPAETMQDLQATYDFIINSGLDGGGAGIAVPYPNTEFWNHAVERGQVNKYMNFARLNLITDFSNLNEDSDFILLSDHLSKKDIVEMGKKIQEHFAVKNAMSLFNSKTFTLRNLMLVIRHPFKFLPFVIHTIKEFIRQYFKSNIFWERG